MIENGKMLVAIMNNHLDFTIARDQHWYRIPVEIVEKRLKNHWPPDWLSFYHTKTFKKNAHSVNYFAKVLEIEEVFRWQLFSDHPRDKKSDRRYFKILISPLKQLPKPIYSRRFRRIIFIPTTWEKFMNAVEINDLYDGSLLEDRLWAELKQKRIQAERQEYVKVKKKNYFLDFAVYCAKGKIDVETDGDKWHHSPEIAPKDNIRNNDLVTVGWQILRFTSRQIVNQMAQYCVPLISDKINNLGGVLEDEDFVRRIDLNLPGDSFQYGLFDI